MTNLFHCLSAETTEDLRLSAVDDVQRGVKAGALEAIEGQAVADPIIPDVEEPLAAGPTSPGCEAHDEGDPMNALGDEATWATTDVPVDPTGARAETVAPTMGNAMQDPPAAMEHAAPKALLIMEVGLECPIWAQQHPRRYTPRIVAVQIEEIPWEPTRPPQVFYTVIRRGDEFDMLEEEVTVEEKRFRANLSSMMGRNEVN